MKRLFLSMMAMAAMATTLTLTSCGSDNDGDNIPGDSSILAADGKEILSASRHWKPATMCWAELSLSKTAAN